MAPPLIPPTIARQGGDQEPDGTGYSAACAEPLRSLDAIQLASALLIGADLPSVVTYDRRMGAAAAIGLPVETPA